MKLSKRLETVANCIASLEHHDFVADIGSDHGYLPTYLVRTGIASKVVACDIADGPLLACQQTIESYQCQDQIDILKGDGLSPLLTYQQPFDVVALCGMGGNLIRDILKRDLDAINVKALVLQANINQRLLRTYLNKHQWSIQHEEIVEDMNHRYEVIVVIKGKEILDEKDILFGPILRRNKSQIFIDKWQWELTIQQNILLGLQVHHPKYQETLHKIKLIQEILYES